ncbi:ketopantoate hydroxymethyltransferase [Hyaloraphidium curvatum]|nr:ketopantoate hydroxymethyltransferase [Hyaloraphidium curvatum]
MMTAYDYPSAMLADRAGVDVCLVGDSLGMVALGMKGTEGVTLDMMVHHTLAVSRGLSPAGPLLLADLPFGSYESSPDAAIRSTLRLVQEGNAEMVKMEGGEEICGSVEAVGGKLGAAVCGHVGLMPQRSGKVGGYKVQAKTADKAISLVKTALALQSAGIALLVLECIPPAVADAITRLVDVPTVGIGAGPRADGQVLVFADALGLSAGRKPKFAKVYADLSVPIEAALREYAAEVRARSFPEMGAHTYAMESPEDEAELREWTEAEVRKKEEREREEASRARRGR